MLGAKRRKSARWWSISLVPAPRKQRQAGLCEFKASLVYRVRAIHCLTTAVTKSRNSHEKEFK